MTVPARSWRDAKIKGFASKQRTERPIADMRQK